MRLQDALNRRKPKVEFVHPEDGLDAGHATAFVVKKLGPESFFGSSKSSIEQHLWEKSVAEAGAQPDLHRFVEDVVALQSGHSEVSHVSMQEFMRSKGAQVGTRLNNRGMHVLDVKLKIGGVQRTIDLDPVPDVATQRSNSALQDLAVILMLRFGAFADNIDNGLDRGPKLSTGTRIIMSANLIIDFLFDNHDRQNARLSLHKRMSDATKQFDKDGQPATLEQAQDLLQEIRKLESAARVTQQKAKSVRTHTLWIVVESVCICILAITLLVVVWMKGGLVLATHRTVPWIASLCLLMYCLARMAWLHIPAAD